MGFELADRLESGAGPGPASHYAGPQESERRFFVKVEASAGVQQHTLMTWAGRRLLIALSSPAGAASGHDIFIAGGGRDVRRAGPDFRLRRGAPGGGAWSLHAARCEGCEARGRRRCGARELARFALRRERIGTSEALCMDVELPGHAGSRAGSPGSPGGGRSPGSPGGGCQVCGACPAEQVTELTSRRPTWDAGCETLNLSFQGRCCNKASVRNFQLEVPGSDPRVPASLLFGECQHEMNLYGKRLFALYFSEPLGTVQAFAAALSTAHWT